jgi:hypothetical protein
MLGTVSGSPSDPGRPWPLERTDGTGQTRCWEWPAFGARELPCDREVKHGVTHPLIYIYVKLEKRLSLCCGDL